MYQFKCLNCGKEQTTQYPYPSVCECGGRDFEVLEKKSKKKGGDEQ